MVLTTFGGESDALRVGKTLVEERLAACMTVLPAATSIYPWKGKIAREAEAVCFLKTSERRVRRLLARLLELHPYETPELLTWSVDSGNEAYSAWLTDWVR
jgi:periplasmic divalent cation tolerance protein